MPWRSADLDGQGMSDFAVVNKDDNSVSVLLRDASGNVTEAPPYKNVGSTSFKRPIALTAAKLRPNVDEEDLIIVNFDHDASSDIVILRNNGRRRFRHGVSAFRWRFPHSNVDRCRRF